MFITDVEDERFVGGIGIVAVIVLLATMVAASLTDNSFSFLNGTMSELLSDNVMVAGCVIAGILGILFGFLITYKKPDSKVLIGLVRGILIMATGATLIAAGLSHGASWAVLLFTVLMILVAVSDIFYNWVTDQKLLMIISLILALAVALPGILAQIGDNNAMGFVFLIFAAVWLLFISVLRFAPLMEEEERARQKGKVKSKQNAKEAGKKNAPVPRPYPGRTEEKPAQKKPAAEHKKPASADKPADNAKAAESKGTGSKEDKPKLKVMSSREAAAARDSARTKDTEAQQKKKSAQAAESSDELVEVDIVETDVVIVSESENEVVVEEILIEEAVFEKVPNAGAGHGGSAHHAAAKPRHVEDDDEEDDEIGITDDSPSAMLRRATWNKGLRCRRDYGEYQIPIAFVKAKVAVYVVESMGANPDDEKLRSKGWTIFRYLEKDITDGKEQAEEINKAVKENLRAERNAKKKKAKK
ncbi:MAG: hypothetical protein LBR42_02740 [Candidatus Methanoplasma sp.]|nr:hypothetical protein [Candidatus Methanoplasma sp.]